MPDIVRLEITDIAFGGKGVARHEGCVVFVPFVIPGEIVQARIVRRKKNFAEAVLVAVEQPSPDRVPAPCPYFGACGGCVYQHIAYGRQLVLKSSQVAQALRRIGKFDDVPMQPAIAAPQPYGYRNRIRVHIAGPRRGFYAHGSREVVDVEQCALASPVVNKSLLRLHRAAMPDGDYSLRAPGGAGPFFEQTNPAVTRELVALVTRTVQQGGGLLIDAYCGAGLFAKALAARFEQVAGIETNSAAIAHARKGAGANERYIAGDVAAHLGEILAAADLARTTVILDPPAEGIEPRVADLLLASPPAEILYVSCDPSTLARDLGALRTAYRLAAVTPIDMFPQTAEVEALAHLVRV